MDTNNWLPFLVAILGSIPSIGALWWKMRDDKRADKDSRSKEYSEQVDRANEITAQAMAMIQPYKDMVTELRDRIKELREVQDMEMKEMQEEVNKLKEISRKNEKRVCSLRRGVIKLVEQLESLEITPVYKLEDLENDE